MSPTNVPRILPDDTARARRTDAITSHEAADSNDVKGSESYVLSLFLHYGPMADFEVLSTQEHEIDQYKGQIVGYSPSRLRTARDRLTKQEALRNTGTFRTRAGENRRHQVWEFAS